MLRTLIAGVLGGIAMFAWTSIAHLATPLASMGLSPIPNEEPVLNAMQSTMGDKSGLYFFPWVDPADPNVAKVYQEKAKTMPSGLVMYRPPSAGAEGIPLQPIEEFAKEIVQTLIAAVLLSLTVLAGYLARVGFVAAIGVSAALATNASYWIWYRFPLEYTLASMTIEIVGALAAGLVIAAIIRTRAA